MAESAVLVLVGGAVVAIAAFIGVVLLPSVRSPTGKPVTITAAPPLATAEERSAQATPPLPTRVATPMVAGLQVSQITQPTNTTQPARIADVVQTTQPTPTIQPAQAAATSASASPVSAVLVPSAAPGPRTVLETLFSAGSQRGWPDNRTGVAWFATDGYHLRSQTPGRFVAIGVPDGRTFADAVVTLRYRKVDGPPGGGVGIIVRDQEPGQRDGLNQSGRFYVLEVSDTGSVGIWRRESDGWVELVAWTPSEAVQSAAEGNVLEARASGSRLTLRVNGQDTVSATDSALGPGGTGIFLGGDANEAVVEHLAVQTP